MPSLLIFAIILQHALEKLDEIAHEDIDLPFDFSRSEDGESLLIYPEATNLPASQQFKNINQLSEKQKKRAEKCLTVHREEFRVTDEYHGKQAVSRIKNKLLPSIMSAIQGHFESLDEPVYKAMNFIDHSRWDYENINYAVDDIKLLTDHFSTTLVYGEFKLDAAVFEFHALKKLVKSRYQHFTHSSTLWKIVANKHHEQFPQILMLILSIKWASSSMEQGSSK